MDITTQTTTLVTITLSEAEARTALVEPEQLQHQLRAALAPIGSARRTRKSLNLAKFAPAPKVAAAPGRKPPERKPCPKCGKSLSPQGMSRHLPTCRGSEPD